MLKKIALLLLACLILIVTAAVLLLPRPDFWEYCIRQALKHEPQVVLNDLHIGRVKLDNGLMVFDNVRATVTVNQQKISLERASVDVFIDQKELRIKAGTLMVNKFVFSDMVFPFHQEQGAWVSPHWQAILAYGMLTGHMHFDPATKTFQGFIEAKGVDTRILAQANPKIFEQLKAVVNGHLSLSGDARGLLSLDGRFDAVNGGLIRGQLLASLVQYMPQKEVLNDLIAKNTDIPLDDGYVTISSLSLEQIRMHVKILSKAMNLDLNLDIDVNLDGGLYNALGAVEQVLKGN